MVPQKEVCRRRTRDITYTRITLTVQLQPRAFSVMPMIVGLPYRAA